MYVETRISNEPGLNITQQLQYIPGSEQSFTSRLLADILCQEFSKKVELCNCERTVNVF